MKTGFEAVKFGVLAYLLPFLFVYRPEILLTVGWGSVAYSIVCILFGIYAIAIAMVGYLNRPLSWIWRLAYLCTALLFFQRFWWGNLIALFFLVTAALIQNKKGTLATA